MYHLPGDIPQLCQVKEKSSVFLRVKIAVKFMVID